MQTQLCWEREAYGLLAEHLFSLKFPQDLYIEPTNDCRLDCIMCPRKTSGRKIGYMDIELFERIISESLQYGRRRNVILHKDGEPLLHPQILEMVKVAKGKNAAQKVSLATSGLELNDRISRGIIDTGLDEINISVDGASNQTYQNIRKNSDYLKVIQNIENLIRLKRKTQFQRPEIVLRIIDMPATKSDLEAFQKSWSGRIDRVEIREFRTWAGHYKDKSKPLRSQRSPCLGLWTTLAVNWDGEVSICSMDFAKKGVVGDVKQGSIYDIWNGESLNRIRKSHLRGDYSQLPLCKQCLDWRNGEKFWDYIKVKR